MKTHPPPPLPLPSNRGFESVSYHPLFSRGRGEGMEGGVLGLGLGGLSSAIFRRAGRTSRLSVEECTLGVLCLGFSIFSFSLLPFLFPPLRLLTRHHTEAPLCTKGKSSKWQLCLQHWRVGPQRPGPFSKMAVKHRLPHCPL